MNSHISSFFFYQYLGAWESENPCSEQQKTNKKDYFAFFFFLYYSSES